MYILDHQSLAWKLNKNKVTNSEAMQYFIGVLLLNIIFGSGGSSESKLVYYLPLLIDLILIVIFYFVNKKGDNKHFIERYFVLQFPVTIKVILIVLPIAIVLVLMTEPSNSRDMLALILIIVLPIYLILEISFMINGLKIASGRVEEASFNRWSVLKPIFFLLFVYGLIILSVFLYERSHYRYQHPELSIDKQITWQPTAGQLDSKKGNVTAISNLTSIKESDLFAGNEQGLFHTTNGGSTWRFIREGKVIAIEKLDDQTAIITMSDKKGIFMSTDNGDTWHKVFDKNSDIEEIFILTKKHYIVHKHNRQVIESKDSGKTWQPMQIGSSMMVYKLLVVDANTIYAFFRKNAIYKSNDSGQTWTKVPYNESSIDGLEFIQTVAAVNANHIIVTMYGGEMYQSMNSGIDWEKTNTRGLGGDYTAIITIDEKTIYVLTPHALFITRNGGEEWQHYGTWPEDQIPTSITRTKDNIIYIGTSAGSIFKSEDMNIVLDKLKTNIPNDKQKNETR